MDWNLHSFRALSYLQIEGTSSVYLTYAYAYVETRTNYCPGLKDNLKQVVLLLICKVRKVAGN